ncbi:hypothetical protein ABEW32_07480 [Paenibacillus jamilae]|uniref:hypothetical protein n=1 Tax=Paenibacillus jamilae TaxID=114136 RepID=UPI003D2E7354
MKRPLRERIILPIAVAPGFLDLKTCKGWNLGAKANASASPERFRPLRCIQHQPSCGSRTREGTAHKMPHLPRAMEKRVPLLFHRKTTFLKGLPNLRSKQPAVLSGTRKAQGAKP